MLRSFAFLFAVGLNVAVPAAQEVVPEVYDDVVLSAEQLQNADAVMRKHCPWQVDRIDVGQLHHPLDDFGIRYHFKPEVVDSYAIRRTAVIAFRYDKREVKKLGKQTGMIQRVVLGDFRFRGVRSSVERVFPLKKSTLYLAVPDSMTYDQSLAMLNAIEKGTFRKRDGIPSVEALELPIDISKITSLRYEPSDGTMEVRTSESRFSGLVLSFAVHPDGFELVSVAHWHA